MKYCNTFCLINDSPEIRSEYKRRHDQIWPEMLELIRLAGLKDYSIWSNGSQLIEFYECDDLDLASKIISASDVKQLWDCYMRDILVYKEDGSSTPLELMFLVK